MTSHTGIGFQNHHQPSESSLIHLRITCFQQVKKRNNMSQSTQHESIPYYENTPLENTPPTAPPPPKDGEDDPEENDPFYETKVSKDSHLQSQTVEQV